MSASAWKNAGKMLLKYAPTIGAVVGGPIGATLGIVGKLAGVLGVSETATEQEISTAIMDASPEMLLKIKQLEANTEMRMRELELETDKLSVESTNSARDLAKITGVHYQFTIFKVLTFVLVLFVAFLFYAILATVKIPVELNTLLSVIFGAVLKAWGDNIHFFSGSSMGSRMKDVR